MANFGEYWRFWRFSQNSPKFATYSYKDDKPQQMREVYVYFEEKYQHYPDILL